MTLPAATIDRIADAFEINNTDVDEVTLNYWIASIVECIRDVWRVETTLGDGDMQCRAAFEEVPDSGWPRLEAVLLTEWASLYLRHNCIANAIGYLAIALERARDAETTPCRPGLEDLTDNGRCIDIDRRLLNLAIVKRNNYLQRDCEGGPTP